LSSNSIQFTTSQLILSNSSITTLGDLQITSSTIRIGGFASYFNVSGCATIQNVTIYFPVPPTGYSRTTLITSSSSCLNASAIDGQVIGNGADCYQVSFVQEKSSLQAIISSSDYCKGLPIEQIAGGIVGGVFGVAILLAIIVVGRRNQLLKEETRMITEQVPMKKFTG